MSKLIILVLVVIFFAGGIFFYQQKFGPITPLPQKSPITAITSTNKPESLTVIATNLEIPWAIAFLPNKDFLFTERAGKLKLFSNGRITTITTIPGVKVYGEGGLMGLVLHPDFKNNHFLYMDFTYSSNGNDTLNRVVRYKYDGGKLTDEKIIVDKIPGAIFHNGGRIKFGPDGFLYITTGDSLNPSLAQNTQSLAGKILRVTDEGSPVTNNPFGTNGRPAGDPRIYSYGHRNPQGIAWDASGKLWETEHGRSNPSGYDEVNQITAGTNYGWPTIQGSETKDGMQSPIIQSGDETWAPAGAVFYNNSMFYGGLKGQSLFELKIINGTPTLTKHLLNDYGRIRDVVLGPDNMLYITTSNRDGRGKPVATDDRIIRIDPSQL